MLDADQPVALVEFQLGLRQADAGQGRAALQTLAEPGEGLACGQGPVAQALAAVVALHHHRAAPQGTGQVPLPGQGLARGTGAGLGDLEAARRREAEAGFQLDAAGQQGGEQQQGYGHQGKPPGGLGGAHGRRRWRLGPGAAAPALHRGAPFHPFQLPQARHLNRPVAGPLQGWRFQHLLEIPGLLAQDGVLAPPQAAATGRRRGRVALAHQGRGH